ncbi:pyrroline-5-carboxylate reductase [Sandaracinobacteroides saxicola]|uniref:Pyrroline-5-carboxylate reductase n=1 Tax=Sandaracinobacteroides saxicola TaxID=2759707 RepID=A0A7G5IKR7_9SPHN|nr:pyrroline-5-carboxylate reductase [Sandaracinobacteroides saxicola]QMW23959.1 pyrroline-5-carboxylate reductase [Sandaracinobacteroides saxicola]
MLNGFQGPLWLVGCGAMGGALLSRWRAAGLRDDQVTVIDPAPKAVPAGFAGILVDSPDAASGTPRLVVLGVKPQMLPVVAASLSARIAGALLISMLAGVRTGTLANLFDRARIARIMPNTPASIGAGVTALYGAGLPAADMAMVEALLKPAGQTLWLEDESRFDAVTALSGSGPAYVFRFIEALAGAGEAAGLDAATAGALAMATVTGAAALAAQSGETPAALRLAVTSPQGTTQAGLDVLDGDGALSALLRGTVRAAAERSRALAAAADAAADAKAAA